MKIYFSIFCLILALPVFAQEKNESETKKDLPPYVIAFDNLKTEDKKVYMGALAEAQRLHGQKRVFECLEQIDKAEHILEGHPAALNLKGACYIELRNFDKARKIYKKVIQAVPKSGNKNVFEFNVAEIEFVTQNWATALKKYDALAEMPRTDANKGIRDLVDYKRLLCKIKLGDVAGAEKIANQYTYLDDTILYYYGKAALAFHKEDDIGAETWINRAARVFGKASAAPWQDTLIEFGYIKSFYGQGGLDEGEEEAGL